MDPVDRLASYLAGELAADERTAMEAELARDPALRAQLEAVQRADTALAGLTSPEPPPGFEDRLAAAVETALAETVRGAPAVSVGTEGDGEPARRRARTGDELATRRARDRRWSWKPALAGAAAAVVLLVAGVAISGLGRDAGDGTLLGEVAVEAPAEEPGDMDVAEDAPEDGPLVVVSGRELDEGDVDALLSGPAVSDVAERRFDDVEGALVAIGWQAALGSTSLLEERPLELFDTDEADAAQPEDEVGADAAELFAPPSERRLAEERPLTPDDEVALTRCLDHLLATEGRAIPAYVEFGTFDGEDAMVFGLVTINPATEAYTRAEAWVLRRTDCELLRFSQDG